MIIQISSRWMAGGSIVSAGKTLTVSPTPPAIRAHGHIAM